MKRKETEKDPYEKSQLAIYRADPSRLHEWFEEVSRITIDCEGSGQVELKLHACGMGIPQQMLEISVVGVPEIGMDFGIDAYELERLAVWLVEAKYLLDSLREKKKKHILAIKRKVGEIHRAKCGSEWSKSKRPSRQ